MTDKKDSAAAPQGSSASLAQALLMAQSEMPTAKINKVNPHFKNKYADLEAVREACIPVFTKHGIAVTQSPGWDPAGRYCMTTRLTHVSTGEFIEGSIPLPDVGKPQEIGAAMTYMRRYGLVALAGLTSEEDDDGESAGEVAKPAQRSNGVTKLKAQLRDFAEEMRTAPSLEAFEQLVAGGAAIIRECQEKIPNWYHGDGSDNEGLAKSIERRRAELGGSKPKGNGISKGTLDPHTPYGDPRPAPPPF